ncbi:GAF domain-containing sensor histidine kinase [Yimella sp. cx-51]|uniref:GAF domain-containing sensor histidine kinase n=1 Tax=Yimella sp. cx-51 TaxID=2770551 RepID=UPI00165D3055|nr:GAF domain-containing protein [Yimella sp. cx-51]MBC9956645.1 GAF domain-containing protein [Yimella sp. cx-51]QTH38886.1 GAF domain-containing protein [Yimella sp. cx-51]
MPERFLPTADPISRVLQAVAQVTGELELEAVLDNIVHTACELVGARFGALGVVDTAGELHGLIFHGVDASVCPIRETPHGRGILRLLVDDPRPIRMAKMSNHPSSVGLPAAHQHMESFLGVPIQGRGKVFGNLYLTEKLDADEFSDQDLAITQSLAAAAAIAIDNAQLFAAAEARQRWLQAGVDAVALINSEGWTPDLWQQIASLVGERVAADHTVFVDGTSGDDQVRLMTDAELIAAGLNPARDTGLLLVIDAGGERLCTVQLGWRQGKDTVRDPIVDQGRSLAERVAGAWLLRLRRTEQEQLAVLEDRDRIARDLHDQVIQRLFATGLTVQATLSSLPLAARPRFDRVVDDLDETIKQIRRTIFELQTGPVALTLPAQISQLAHDSSAAMGHTPQIDLHGELSQVSDELATEVLVVLRECFANVARHSGASSSSARIDIDTDELRIVVQDDGIGLGEATRRSGLLNISERAQRHGGAASASSPGSGGTQVLWKVPLR